MTEITAPLTGTVFRVLVEEGDEVAAGDTVVVLESMKMEINVDAMFDGTVAEIVRAEGDVVQADDVLLYLND
jgi:acetyl-CoA carboxylase biotin carboxyl carrier protein